MAAFSWQRPQLEAKIMPALIMLTKLEIILQKGNIAISICMSLGMSLIKFINYMSGCTQITVILFIINMTLNIHLS